MQRRRRRRTKLKDRPLPTYTKGEEIFNMVSHIVGGAIGIAALVLCIVFSAIHKNGYGLAGSIVYGISMITLYTILFACASMIYYYWFVWSVYESKHAGQASSYVMGWFDRMNHYVDITLKHLGKGE